MTQSNVNFKAIELLIENGLKEEARRLFDSNYSTPQKPIAKSPKLPLNAFEERIGLDGLRRHTTNALRSLAMHYIQKQQQLNNRVDVLTSHSLVMNHIQYLVDIGEWQYLPGDNELKKGKTKKVLNDELSYALRILEKEGFLKRENPGSHTLISIQWIK